MKKIILFCLAISFGFFSCVSTRYIEIEVLRPADINTGDKPANFLLAGSEEPYLQVIGDHNEPGAITHALNICLDGLEKELARHKDFRVLKRLGVEGDINRETASALCSRWNASGLIILDGVEVIVRNRVRPYATNMRIDPSGHYEQSESITTSWRFYDPEKNRFYSKSYTYDGERKHDFGGTSRDASREMMLYQSLQAAGKTFMKAITPSWEPDFRTLYLTSHPDMQKAFRRAQDNQWKEAARIWLEYMDHPRSGISRAATCNLAVAFEMLGDLETAKDLSRKAFREHVSFSAASYSKILENRIREDSIVRQQLN